MTLLLLANLGLWAYTQGHLDWLGLAPRTPNEPERLARQLAPEKLTVLNTPNAPTAQAPEAASVPTPEPDKAAQAAAPGAVAAAPVVPAPAPTPAPAAAPPPPKVPTACWQTTGLPPSQTVLVRGALQNLPGLTAGDWTLTEGVLPARWIVYQGKFANAEALQRRRAELREAGVDHREVATPALQPGLALGTYSTEEAARRALAETVLRGVDGVRVVQERQETRSHTLRLPSLTEAQRRQINATRVLDGKPLQRCP